MGCILSPPGNTTKPSVNWYFDDTEMVHNTVEDNSSMFSVIRTHLLPSVL